VNIMGTQKNSTPNLLRALKPEASVSTEAVKQAAVEAQEHWPLLKSVRPEKWLLAPKLSDKEKRVRLAVDAPVTAPKIAPRASSSLDLRLAQGLHRMKVSISSKIEAAAPDEVIEPVPVAQIVPIELFKNITVVPPTETAQPAPAPIDDDSIQAVLSRVLQANEKAVQASTSTSLKQPGFLSRLGKR
jgi:hypothetical protein